MFLSLSQLFTVVQTYYFAYRGRAIDLESRDYKAECIFGMENNTHSGTLGQAVANGEPPELVTPGVALFDVVHIHQLDIFVHDLGSPRRAAEVNLSLYEEDMLVIFDKLQKTNALVLGLPGQMLRHRNELATLLNQSELVALEDQYAASVLVDYPMLLLTGLSL